MPESIIDGTGKGFEARVDSTFRLHTHSVSETVGENASETGNSYNINTGSIELTTATESAILYIKNNGDFNLRISTIGFLIGNSTGGTGDLNLRVDKNSITGTIITNAVDVDINQNKNVGSSRNLTANAYKGVEGDTATLGVNLYTSLLAGAARTYSIATGDVNIPKGGSITVFCTPQTSNTSMNIQVFLAVTDYQLNGDS